MEDGLERNTRVGYCCAHNLFYRTEFLITHEDVIFQENSNKTHTQHHWSKQDLGPGIYVHRLELVANESKRLAVGP